MEWTSLILFTVTAEVAVGLVLVYWLYGFTAAARAKAEAYDMLAKPVLLCTWALTGLSALFSATHLGWPLSAARAFSHLGSSWLSREALFELLFGAVAIIMWAMLLRGGKRLSAGWYAGLSGIGIAATFSSGMIYTLPSIPANNNAFPVTFFFATALVTGSALLLTLLAVTKAGKELAEDLTGSLSLLTLGALGLSAVLTLTYVSAAGAGAPEARKQAAAMVAGLLYPARLVVGLLLPAGIAVWLVRKPKHWAGAAAVLLLAVLAGEFAGRYLFFTSSVFLGINSGL